MQQRGGGVELAVYGDDALMFELAPVSLWLEDLQRSQDTVRLTGDAAALPTCATSCARIPSASRACSERSPRAQGQPARRSTLFEARDLPQLVDNLERDLPRRHVPRPTSRNSPQLWEGGDQFFSQTVNYTLSGRRLDIQLKGTVLPGYEDDWERVLVAIEDVTAARERAARLALSEQYARGLFEHSPVSLWVEDFSAIKRLLDEVRGRGISDFRVFTDVHPEFVHAA